MSVDLLDDRLKNLTCAYLDAKRFIINRGYAEEIDWQEALTINDISEQDFLREAAWVILSAGMRESVIRGIFPRFSNAFYNWESAKTIDGNKIKCKNDALKIFNHQGKISAIVFIAQAVYEETFPVIVENIKHSGTEYLKTFPYIGPAVSHHLAKNIGIDTVKPDRHLVRVSKACGFQNPDELCINLSRVVGDDIKTIDLVLWRYATLQSDYVDHFLSYF